MADTPTPDSHEVSDTAEPQPADPTPKKAAETQNLGTSGCLLVGLILLLFFSLPLIWYRGLGVLAFAETLLREWLYLVLLLVLPLGFATVWGLNRDELKKRDPLRAKKQGRSALAALTLAVVGGAYSFAVHPYLVAQSFTKDTQTSEETTSYADRAPWIVAHNYAQRDQGDVIGDRGAVHYVPSVQDAKAKAGDGTGEGTSRYTVLVRERGVLGTGGYEAVQTLTMPTTGTIPASASSYCEVPDSMSKRLETNFPWHSLAWSIYAKAPLTHFNHEDAYGYCVDDQPVIVVPLWDYQGFWAVTKRPAGAAIYRESGLEILTPEELIAQGIEGPTYPRSLAERQRVSINAGGTLMQWWGSKYGYDLTDLDEEDSNADNPAEFTLVSPQGADLSYVSPLTPRGSSQSITALSVIPAQQVRAEREPVVVNVSTDLPATSTLETAIKESSVAGDNSWTTRWSAGMRVYEILPARDGHWAASIGQGQAVSYRADIAPDGRVTVVNAETGQSSSGASQSESVTLESGQPLAEMTEAELLDLIQQAVSELEKRQD